VQSAAEEGRKAGDRTFYAWWPKTAVEARKLEWIGRRNQALPFSSYRLASLLLVLGSCLGAEAQSGMKPAAAGAVKTAAAATTEPALLEEVPRVPGVRTLLRGLNAGFTVSGVHDSSIGWYNVATSAVSYTFSPHYSADASVSIYPYRLVDAQVATPQSSAGLTPHLGDVGDTFIGLHASFNPGIFWNTTTASFTVPTGDRSDGLGTGRVTFDFSDHLERSFRQTSFLLDLGAGDSSGLFNRMVTSDYSSLGALAHFQTGMSFWLPGHNYLQSVAYEQLPMGKQTVYTIAGSPNDPTRTVVSGSNVSEDNGITTSLGIPLTDHITWSGYYNRSFRQHLDTVSTGFTFVLRGTPRNKRMSLIDRALREAERVDP
jgi:hypothetical protein